MSRIDDLLKAAAERGEPRGADATLDAARDDATEGGATGGGEAPFRRPSPKILGLLAAAALLIVAVAAVALVGGGDNGRQVATSPDGTQPPKTTDVGPPASTGTGGNRPCLTEPVTTEGELAFYATCSGTSATGPYPIYRTAPSSSEAQALLLSTRLNDREWELGLTSLLADDLAGEDVNASTRDDDNNGTVSFAFEVDGVSWAPDGLTTDNRADLVRQLAATLFRFDEVQGIDRSSLCFGADECDGVMTRQEWTSSLLGETGTVVYDRCTPADAWITPEFCTVAGLLKRGTGTANVIDVAADDTLLVRGGPGPDYPKIGELAPDATVDYTIAVNKAPDGGTWRVVDGPGAPTGWVNEAYLELIEGQETLITLATRPSSIPAAPTPEDTTATEPDVTAPPTTPPAPPSTGPAPGRPGEGPVTTNPSGDDPYLLADAFLVFASRPTAANFAALPLADNVRLGLGSELTATRPATDLTRPDGWVLEVPSFRAHAGPFSALEVLDRATDAQVTIGEHPHCAGPPVPPPAELKGLKRISVQPPEGDYTSCLQWYTVDFFVSDDGKVAAITMDLWEP